MSSNDDVLVRVEGVSKRFCKNLKRSLWYGVEDTVADCVGLKGGTPELRRDEFWAVNDVSFELKRGECLGLIGHNGAGKTTLLKMLNGLIKPDKGRIEMRGRIGALIALGAGFNPILSGRENIYVNGSVLGLTKREIDAKVDEIIDFAEIGEFIDAPVQSYSSGMGVRLGFAVATALQPDVLLLDEVLAVGDIGFRTKCYNRMERMKEHSAMILVSHQMSDIARIATRTLTHDQRRFVSMPTNEGIRRYGASLDRKTEGYEHCEPGFRIQSITVSPQRPSWKDIVCISLSFDSPQAIEDVETRVTFTNFGGEPLAEWRATNHANLVCLAEGQNTLEFRIGPVMLAPGTYPICIILTKPGLAQYLLLSYQQNMVSIGGGEIPVSSHYQMDGSARMLQRSELNAAGLAARG